MPEPQPDPDRAHDADADADTGTEDPRRRRRGASLVSAASAAGAAVIAFRPLMLMIIDVVGIHGGAARSCTMEQAAQCAVTEAPDLLATLFEVLVVVLAAIVVTGAAGIVVLLTLLVDRGERPPVVRIAAGSFLVTFSLVGIVALIAAAH